MTTLTNPAFPSATWVRAATASVCSDRAKHVIARSALILVLLAAAGLKAHVLITAPFEAISPPEAESAAAWWLQIAMIESEMLFAMWLLSGIAVTRSWRLAILIFGLLGCVSVYKIVKNEVSCGCFGVLHVSPWYSLAINIAAIGLILLAPPPSGAPISRTSRRLRWVFVFGAAALAIVAAIVLCAYRPVILAADDVAASGRSYLLRPARWLGRECPLLAYCGSGEELRKGEWIVVLHRPGCHNCAVVVREFDRFVRRVRSNPPLGLGLISLSSTADSRFEDVSAPGSGFVSCRLQRSVAWHAAPPTVILLSDGIVEFSIEGAVSGSSETLREFLASRWRSAQALADLSEDQEDAPKLPPARAPVPDSR